MLPTMVISFAHHVHELNQYRFFVHANDSERGALLGGGQRGVHDGGHTRGVEVDVGAGLAGEHPVPHAVQFDQALDDILVGRV